MWVIIIFMTCWTLGYPSTEPCIAPVLAQGRATNESYFAAREAILAAEDARRIGGDIVLTPDEEAVNAILMERKRAEFTSARNGDTPFPPAIHFFKAKPLIDQSGVFEIIRAMPKGAVLHVHDVLLLSLDWLVHNVTYRPHLYICLLGNSVVRFRFALEIPEIIPDCIRWQVVSELRSSFGNPEEFDHWIYEKLSMVVDNPEVVHPDTNTAWHHFANVIGPATDLIFHAPVFREYMYNALEEFREDNVQYMELRGTLTGVYELDGSEHDKQWVVQTYKDVFEQFALDHPDVSGAKLIYSEIRFKNQSDIMEGVREAIDLVDRFPGFLLGFDLVAQEDLGYPLIYYINELLSPDSNHQLPYFFHAAETDWQGTPIDENIIDAVLLNTSRIGHGYGLPKHPEVMKLVKERGIAIEVNPISNQVLGLVSDLRNHPMAFLMADNYPIVISCDDPSVWGNTGLSYDFYEAFMGLAGEDADLRLLKQLALNSLRYSMMSDTEKTAAMDLWQGKWEHFIRYILDTHGAGTTDSTIG